MLVPKPPRPNKPTSVELLNAHSNLYKPKFFRVNNIGSQSNIINDENPLEFICNNASTFLVLILSICSLITFAFIAVYGKNMETIATDISIP